MRHLLVTSLAVLALSGCNKSDGTTTPADESGGPQIATSIDDETLPLDRSDQISAIDAATGDARGMPRDGGAVIRTPLQQDKAPDAVQDNGVIPVPAVVVPAAPLPPTNASIPVQSSAPAQ